MIELFEPDGTLVASRTFPDEVAVTALDGFSSGGVGMVLLTGRVTQDGTALVATHGLSGRLLWSDNHRVAGEPLDYPVSIAVGPFGSAGAATVSVAWSVDGRLTLHDASRGTRPYSEEGQPLNPVTAQRFVTGRNGQHLLAVQRLRDAHAVLVSGGNATAWPDPPSTDALRLSALDGRGTPTPTGAGPGGGGSPTHRPSRPRHRRVRS